MAEDDFLEEQRKLLEIKGISIASSNLKERKVSRRQTEQAEKVLRERYSVPVNIKVEYISTLSTGSEINLYASTDSGSIVWSDVRGEYKKYAEDVGKEAANKMIKELESGAACDMHLSDNLVPWLALLGGKIRTSEITLHAKTNMWGCELFFGKMFSVEGNTIHSSGMAKDIADVYG